MTDIEQSSISIFEAEKKLVPVHQRISASMLPSLPGYKQYEIKSDANL